MACSAASEVSTTGCALSSSVMSRNEADMKPTEPSYSMQYQGALERSVTVTSAPLGKQSTMRNSVPGPSRILTSLPVTTAVSAQAEACVSTANKNANRSVLKNFLSMPNRSFICITLVKTSCQSAGTGLPAPRLSFIIWRQALCQARRRRRRSRCKGCPFPSSSRSGRGT